MNSMNLEELIIDSHYSTNNPVTLINRVVVFNEAQALYAFSPLIGPDLVLCVKVPNCLWVTNCAEAIQFFKENNK
jgi:hypothetical protein